VEGFLGEETAESEPVEEREKEEFVLTTVCGDP
jgi:hypothetical protein